MQTQQSGINFAVGQGAAYAQLNLGMMYYREEGILQIYKEAVKCHRMAA
jgi:Sel1 repeat.